MQKRWLSFFGIAVIVVGVVFLNRYYISTYGSQPTSMDSTGIASIHVSEPNLLYGMVVDNHVVIEDKIKRNERLGDILEAYHVPAKLIHQLSQISRSVFDV